MSDQALRTMRVVVLFWLDRSDPAMLQFLFAWSLLAPTFARCIADGSYWSQ